MKYTAAMLSSAMDSGYRSLLSSTTSKASDAIVGILKPDHCLPLMTEYALNDFRRDIGVQGQSIIISGAYRHLQAILGYGFGASYGCDIQRRPTSKYSDLRDALCLGVYLPRNSDYGDAFAMCGVPGICVRLMDKIQRISHLAKSEDKSGMVGEKVSDTVIDATNYAAIGLMLLGEGQQ